MFKSSIFHNKSVSVKCLRSNIVNLDLQIVAGDDIVMSIVGNKVDLNDQRDVERSRAETYAKRLNAKYFETSAYTGQGKCGKNY